MSNLETLYINYRLSPWLDNLSRDLLDSGMLAKYIEDGIRGITSNPSIFEKAISQGDLYKTQISNFADKGLNAEEIYWELAKQDVKCASKLLLPLYAQSKKIDGYVSLEVSPALAKNTSGTIAQARELWHELQCPNLMIKVPATKEGVQAITTLLSEGININVTLLFSHKRYLEVIEAYKKGVKQCKTTKPASVASFFVSRIDSMVDAELKALDSPEASNLEGKSAIAQARVAYDIYQNEFKKDSDLAPQRLLLASTSTKNPDYDDLMYVNNLIAPEIINTLPEATLKAIEDHLPTELSKMSSDDVADSKKILQDIANVGVDFDDCLLRLEKEGLDKFSDAYNSLISVIKQQMD